MVQPLLAARVSGEWHQPLWLVMLELLFPLTLERLSRRLGGSCWVRCSPTRAMRYGARRKTMQAAGARDNASLVDGMIGAETEVPR